MDFNFFSRILLVRRLELHFFIAIFLSNFGKKHVMKFYFSFIFLFFIQFVQAQEVVDTTFVTIQAYSADFIFDMKYATEDNFLNAKVYDCATCILRYKTVKNLIEANKHFMRKGYRIKLYDCYRPLDIQKKMWQIISNPEYVANPAKGSIHNRGGAVDITLVDQDGNELDMGTKFDHFGPESSHFYSDLPREIIRNRRFLKKIMEKHNFESFDSEWWHYNLIDAKKDKLSNFNWKCN